MQSHINQSESAGPNPVQPTIALAKKWETFFFNSLVQLS